MGPIFYSASTCICAPNALTQNGGGHRPLGAQAGPGRLRNVVEAAGFTRFRWAAETPFNVVLDIRP